MSPELAPRDPAAVVHGGTGRPGPVVIATGVLVALCCVGFAVVNVFFEVTDRFGEGRYADYVAAITVMNWLVVVLKLVGAVAAVSSILPRRLLPPRVLTVLLWGGFATLAVYATGAVVEGIGIALGVIGTREEIDLAGIGYLVFFVLMATGFGVLAVSWSRRHRTRRRFAVLGVLGAPLLLALVLVVMPMLLTALGLMPSS